VPRGGAHRECRRCVPSLGARFGAFLSGGGAGSRTSPWAPATVLKIVFGRRGEGLGTLGALERPRLASARLPAPRVSAAETPRASSVTEGGLPSPVCSLLRVLTPVGLAPPERPGGKLLWGPGTSSLRLRPPALAGAGSTHSEGAQRGPERGRAAGEARGRRGRARAVTLGPAVQGKWRSSGTALSFGLHTHLHTPTCHLRYLDCLDHPELCGEASGGVWRRALA
jgi:hypothetical protein